MNIFCKKISVLLLCGILFGGACSDDAPSGEDSGQQTYSLVVKSITASGEDSFGELREVSVFQFSDGILYRTQLLNPKQDGHPASPRSAARGYIFFRKCSCLFRKRALPKKSCVIWPLAKDFMIIPLRTSCRRWFNWKMMPRHAVIRRSVWP